MSRTSNNTTQPDDPEPSVPNSGGASQQGKRGTNMYDTPNVHFALILKIYSITMLPPTWPNREHGKSHLLLHIFNIIIFLQGTQGSHAGSTCNNETQPHDPEPSVPNSGGASQQGKRGTNMCDTPNVHFALILKIYSIKMLPPTWPNREHGKSHLLLPIFNIIILLQGTQGSHVGRTCNNATQPDEPEPSVPNSGASQQGKQGTHMYDTPSVHFGIYF